MQPDEKLEQSIKSNTISSKGCSNLIVSTYSKDYVLITEGQFETAKRALLELGLTEELQ